MAQKKSAVALEENSVSAPEWTEILRKMIFIRRFEEATEREFRKGKIGGYLHVYSGQEAVASGILTATRRKDDVVYCRLPRPRARAARSAATRSRDGRAVRQAAPASRTARGARCTSSTPSTASTAATASSADIFTLAAGSAYALRYQGTDRIARLLLRRRRDEHRLVPRGAEHGRASGASRGCAPHLSSSRTTATRWGPRSSATRR